MAVTRGNPDVQALGGIKDGLGGEKVCGFLGSNSFTNNAIQAGSLDCTATAGSGWVIFGKPFTNPPIIVGCVASGNMFPRTHTLVFKNSSVIGLEPSS